MANQKYYSIIVSSWYYTYRSVEESYISKEGKSVEYTQTSRVTECKPASNIVKFMLNGDEKYLKPSSFVGTAPPLIKDRYKGKYIELDV